MRGKLRTSLVIWSAAACLAGGAALAQGGHPALNQPSKFAWEVFLRINHPANNGTNDVEWETWATDEETFPNPAIAGQPPTWPGARSRPKQLHESRQLQAAEQGRLRQFGIRPRLTTGGSMEVRRNQSAFDFIVRKELWHLNGIKAAFQSGDPISFEEDAIEIKATWKVIQPSDKPRYHWNVDENGTLFGLTALHITTKDLPNWFWATFEHVENPDLGREQKCRDDFGAADPNDCQSGPSQALKDLIQAQGLGEQWLNYRLDGTQVDFVDSIGRPTFLGNSEIEGPFMHTSSCITCHARAAVLADGAFLDIFKSLDPLEGNVGVPETSWFIHPDGARRALQLDFVWGFEQAKPLQTMTGSLQPRTAAAPEAESPSADKLQSAAKLASQYAVAVAGDDDARLVKVFQDSLRSGFAAQAGPAVEPEPTPFDSPLPAHKTGEFRPKDPVLLKNEAQMIREMTSRPRIVGGATTTDYADCVAVGANGYWCCTGTLIAPNAVLTAGHCDEGTCSVRVFVGSDVDNPGAAKTYQVQTAVRHPDYDPVTLENDLTVLILETSVTDVTPRALATTAETDGAISVRAVGFGNTNFSGTTGYGRKRLVDVGIAASVCTPAAATEYGCHRDKELVAGAPMLNLDTCTGDSGGPAYIQVNGEWKLAGATSRAVRLSPRTCGDGGNYVRVDKYADWIESVLQAQ